MGRFNDDQYGTPSYDTYLPMENGTAAEILRENGYATFCVGKYNGAPHENGTLAGPYNRWATGRGFDHFYGFCAPAGADDQWHPKLYRDTHREPDDSLGQPAITRFASEAINYIADQQSAAPDQPFFLYFAPGTAHTPFHASKEWVDKYHGRFDGGWEDYARRTLENQLREGIVPKGTELPVPNADVPAWDTLSDDEKKLYARQMEVFAGFLSQADHEIGRIVEFLRRTGELDNTLIIVALGDNGASGEGGRTGGRELTPEQEKAYIAVELAQYDHYGDERTWPFYPAGWAQACNTPFRYYKKWSDYEGGTHDGLIVFYPEGIRENGGIRTQYTHVTDILPTTVELIGATYPETINGYPQTKIEGTSFAHAVTSPDNNVEERKLLQYYELNSSYALYKDGWKVQFPNGLVNSQRRNIYPDTEARLYNLREDFNESRDLSKKYPGKVKEMLAEFDRLAWEYGIYPLKDGKKADPAYPVPHRDHYDIFVGARRYGEYAYFDGSGRSEGQGCPDLPGALCPLRPRRDARLRHTAGRPDRRRPQTAGRRLHRQGRRHPQGQEQDAHPTLYQRNTGRRRGPFRQGQPPRKEQLHRGRPPVGRPRQRRLRLPLLLHRQDLQGYGGRKALRNGPNAFQ